MWSVVTNLVRFYSVQKNIYKPPQDCKMLLPCYLKVVLSTIVPFRGL